MRKAILALICSWALAFPAVPQQVVGKHRKIFAGGGGGGTWSYVDSWGCSGSGTCAISAPSVGDTLTVTVMWVSGNAVATCNNGSGHNFTMPATVATNSTGGLQTQNGYILASTSGASSSVVCAAGSTAYIEVHVGQFRDTGGTPTFDQVVASPANSNASGTSVAVPTFTPATAGSLAWCAVLTNNGTISAPTTGGTLSGWTGAQNPNGGSEYKLSSAASSQSCSFTASFSGDNIASVVTVIKS